MPVWIRLMRAFHRHLALMSWGVLLGVVLLHSLVSWELMLLAGEEKLVTATDWFYYYIVTATTIGYGDLSPQTALGKLLASVVMILGYAIIAVPTGIVTSEFTAARRRGSSRQACPSCGREGHDEDATHCKFCGTRL